MTSCYSGRKEPRSETADIHSIALFTTGIGIPLGMLSHDMHECYHPSIHPPSKPYLSHTRQLAVEKGIDCILASPQKCSSMLHTSE